MFQELKHLTQKPQPFEFYTTELLWNDPHISEQMLRYHLDEKVDAASRNHEFIQRSTRWLIEHFHMGSQMSVCDFGCGPGLYTLGLARSGAAVTGVDFSQRSIAYAREAADKENLPIEYIQQNYLEYASPEKFDLILMIYCDFCVLSPVQRRIFLQKCRSLLKPGGFFVFDVCQEAAFEKVRESVTVEHQSGGGFWSAEEYICLMNVYKYPQEEVSLDLYTILQAGRTWQVYNWLQYYSVESMSELLGECGLETVECFGNVAGDPYSAQADEFALAARVKKAASS